MAASRSRKINERPRPPRVFYRLELGTYSDEYYRPFRESLWNFTIMLKPVGFWSYSSSDERHSHGKLSQLRHQLAAEMQQQIGRMPEVKIFQDVEAIPPGADWEKRIQAALQASSFVIPIITPGFFQSEWCCREIDLFQNIEKKFDQSELIFPIHYIDTDDIDSNNLDDCHDHSVFQFLKTRQWTEFRKLRLKNAEHEDVLSTVEKLARAIRAALRASTSPRPSRLGSNTGGIMATSSPAVESPSFWKNGKQPGFIDESGTDRFGRWLEFSVPDSGGAAVTQRMRWIPPGSFLMGLPADEAQRSDDEGPQHEVTISQGFWLGDTACTQALWQAVMGANPSRFKGDDRRPVECVSWYDVQGFLQRIAVSRPGLTLSLPSEAEWEYACRAGTTTPFSFGTGITPDQVNYNGNYPYPDGKKGRYREETVPVGSLPANPWGLFEMHGNVLEWCADGYRKYDLAPQTDPRGPEGKTSGRALRGGSWDDGARWARSACRDARLPGDAVVLLGFRLCLRSIESSPAEPAG